MMYYSHEARESAIKDIRSIIKTLGEVKNGELDYLTYRGTVKYLNDLIEQIEKEDKSLSIKFDRVPRLTNACGNNEMLKDLFWHIEDGTVESIYDSIEDSHSVNSLISNLSKLNINKQFTFDRETASYVRLKSMNASGDIYYLTIKKLVG